MSFIEHLKHQNESTLAGDIASVDSKLDTKPVKRLLKRSDLVSEQSPTNDIINALNKGGFKIKLVNPTPFGLQVDFFKKPNKDDISELLNKININDQSIKFKNLSIFIEM